MRDLHNKDLVNNKIYFLQVHEKVRNGIPLSKVGDTVREVEERNSETILNASLHRSNKVTYWKAEKADGTLFRDKKLHKFLEDKGYERELNDNGNKSEWFYDLSYKIFITLFEEFINKKPRKPYKLRKAQKHLSKKILEAFKTVKYLNLNACVRVGKTILSQDTAKQLNMMPCYIGKNLTSQSSARKTFEDIDIVESMCTISIHGEEKEVEEGYTKKVKRIISEIEKENILNQRILFFVDEVDDASHTILARKTMKPVIQYFKDNDLFGGFITMTGTRAHRGLKVLNDVKDKDDKLVEIELPYYEMQQIQPETTCQRDFTSVTIYNENENAPLSNISGAMKTAPGRESIAKSIISLFEDNSFNIKYNDNFPNIFIKISTIGKSNATSLVSLLNKKYSVVKGTEYKYVNINGNTTTSREAEEYCEKIINKNKDKKIVFITQGMATTSFSIESIGTAIVFTDNEMTADDVQGIHRSCTFAPGKTNTNLILITTNDSKELQFDDPFEDELKKAYDKESTREIYKSINQYNSITHFLVNASKNTIDTPVIVTEQNIERYIDIKQQYQIALSSQVQAVIDEEFTFLKTLKSNKTSKKSKCNNSSKSENPLGDLPSAEHETKNKSKEISKETKAKRLKALFSAISNMMAYDGNNQCTTPSFNLFGVNEKVFYECEKLKVLSDRWNSIYELCKDDKTFIRLYADKIAELNTF